MAIAPDPDTSQSCPVCLQKDAAQPSHGMCAALLHECEELGPGSRPVTTGTGLVLPCPAASPELLLLESSKALLQASAVPQGIPGTTAKQ